MRQAGRWAGRRGSAARWEIERCSSQRMPGLAHQHSEHMLQFQSKCKQPAAAEDQADAVRGCSRPTHPHLRGPLLDAGQCRVWCHVCEGDVADAQAVQHIGNLVNVSKVKQGGVCRAAQAGGGRGGGSVILNLCTRWGAWRSMLPAAPPASQPASPPTPQPPPPPPPPPHQ